MTRLSAGAFADGAPVGASGAPSSSYPTSSGFSAPTGYSSAAGGPPGNLYGIPDEFATPPGGIVERASRAASRIRSIEGQRGYSTRASVVFRNVAAFFSLIASVGFTHWAFAEVPAWQFGGIVMMYSVAFMMVIACIGTVLYADARWEIVQQCRHFVYGIVVLPGTALALFMRLVHQVFNAPSAQDDMFVAVLRGNALPLVYFSVVVIPTFVFAKYVFGGIRSAHKSALTDEEMLATYMRQDGWQY